MILVRNRDLILVICHFKKVTVVFSRLKMSTLVRMNSGSGNKSV